MSWEVYNLIDRSSKFVKEHFTWDERMKSKQLYNECPKKSIDVLQKFGTNHVLDIFLFLSADDACRLRRTCKVRNYYDYTRSFIFYIYYIAL